MSQENVEMVRRVSHRGRDAAQGFIEDQINTSEAWTAEPDEFYDGEDQVVVFVKVRAQPKGGSRSSREGAARYVRGSGFS